jgi:hypothetical protein
MVAAGPAFGQAEEDPRQNEIEAQIDRAVQELFQDHQLPGAEDEPEDPRERIIRDRQREEAFKRRLLQLQLEQQRGGFVQVERAAEPIQLDAKAYVDPWADHTRQDIIAALDHSSFAKRESAEISLLADNTLTKDDLTVLIKSAKSPEQRKRLLRVAEHHVLRMMRQRDFGLGRPGPDADPDVALPQLPERQPASVGYSYEPILAHQNPYADLPGVQVIATMPGFPGHAHLRRGDIIVQINGMGLSRHHREGDITNWVRWQISQRSAGETIEFTLLREGEMLSIKMICAEGRALDHMYTTDASQAAARKQPYRTDWEQVESDLSALMPQPKKLTPKVVEVAE